MPASIRRLDEALRHAARLRHELGDQLREVRLAAGLSQAAVGRALGCSASTVSRIERGAWPNVGLAALARQAGVLGHVLRATMYPVGTAIRDAGQIRLLNRLAHQIPTPPWRWAVEVPVGPDDLRAFDAVAASASGRIGFDAWTRIRDVQAQARGSMRKAVDGHVDRLVLVLADTQHNRAAVAEAGEALRRSFPATTRQVLAALRRGELPPSNGIAFL